MKILKNKQFKNHVTSLEIDGKYYPRGKNKKSQRFKNRYTLKRIISNTNDKSNCCILKSIKVVSINNKKYTVTEFNGFMIEKIKYKTIVLKNK